MITNPEIREGVRFKDYFSKYNWPGFASNVWNAYHKELVAKDLLDEGITVLGECRTVSSLDVGLHHLLQAHNPTFNSQSGGSSVPLECEVEDWAVIDPAKYVDQTESGHGSFAYPRL